MHIETAVREISKSMARMVACMRMPNVSSRALSGGRFPGQTGFELYNEEYVRIFFCEAGQTPDRSAPWITFSSGYLPLEAVFSSEFLVVVEEGKSENRKQQKGTSTTPPLYKPQERGTGYA